MKTKIFLSILTLGFFLSAFSQNTIELTFTAIDSATYIQTDSIKVMNRTQGGDTVLYYPDTILVLDYQIGISETNIGTEGFQVIQNYPNPVIDKTTVSFNIPEKDKVNLIVTDLFGRVLIKTEQILDQGYHSFHFTPGRGSLNLFTVQWRESSSSIKILQTNPVSDNAIKLEYMGNDFPSPRFKVANNIQSFLFNLGDELLYIGYIDTLQSGMLDTPETSESYTFQFATNIPCLETPTVTYEGQVYNTIQIFNQCWLRENLNVGTMVNSIDDMENNGIIEKYCYNNEPDSCTKYGGLYHWDEMMMYNSQQGVQGICPPGWHIPSDEEWKVIEGTVDNNYKIGDSIWNTSGYRGLNAGDNLKTINGWDSIGNGNDLFNFSGLPGGYGFRNSNGVTFIGLGLNGNWWTSSSFIFNDAYYRGVGYLSSKVRRILFEHDDGKFSFSARCIRND